jgi:tight adherence protein B
MTIAFWDHRPLREVLSGFGLDFKVAPMVGMKWGGVLLLAFAVFIALVGIATDAESYGFRSWVRYTSYLDRSLRAMFVFIPGRKIALYQLCAAVGLVAFGFVTGNRLFHAMVLLVGYAPTIWIKQKQKKRVVLAEEQLPGFLQILANALRASPNIASAMQAIVGSLEPPMKDEVALALKELKIGAPLDQALLHMAVRLKSRPVDSAISAILIGRQVGGDLPKILDTTASSLREIFRLEGVVKSKTASARNQLLLMTFMPPVLILFFSTIQPGFFDPLTQDFMGYCVAAGAAGCWLVSLLWARKILAVDV